ncbi:hypothetical protein BKK51_08400 [Rodentibacter trehalosifermentans]|uniref:Autotransporter adhesin n=1 Tax=Rodentibacter trehalosifermentans TaxID=1908263 RepID=A0A1V3IR54_9PAST|nr:YadA-like family protein [Rodentibacter trehalosifermentans]OOF44738.1 hypothetical protein BKK51_08400 [Rodentibacter trehalosifermentans]
MNKIFKVIWNHATQSFVVVSELTKRKGKQSSSTDQRLAPSKLLVAMGMSGALLMGQSALAAKADRLIVKDAGTPVKNVNNPSGNILIDTDYDGNIALGRDAIATGDNATAVGRNANATVKEAVVVGANAQGIRANEEGIQNRHVVVIGSDAIVRNTDKAQSRGTTVIGGNALAGFLTNGTLTTQDNLNDADYATATGDLTVDRLMYRAGMKDATGNTIPNDVDRQGNVINYYTSNEATSIGFDSRAIGDQSIAIGAQVIAGHSSVAIGGNDMTTVNTQTNRDIYKNIVGEDLEPNTIKTNDRDAQGNIKEFYETTYAKSGSVVIGQKSHSNELFGTAIGTAAFVQAGAELGTAIGTGARVGNQTNTDINGATFSSTSQKSTKGGVAIAAGSVAEGDYTTAVGTGAKALEMNATAVGYKALANATNALAFGANAESNATDAVAMGSNAKVTSTGESSIAFGTGTTVSGMKSVALGSNIQSLRTDGSVVLGDSSTDVYTNPTTGITEGSLDEVKPVANATVRTSTGGEFIYTGFAGQPADAGKYVSIGAMGAERQLKNVAAGNIHANSTDAINGSQLYAVMTKAASPLTFMANTNKASREVFNTTTNATETVKETVENVGLDRQLGQTLNIIGAQSAVSLTRNSDAAVSGAYSAKNIQTFVDNNGVQIQMAENPEFTSTKIGGTKTTDKDGNEVIENPITIGTTDGKNVIGNLTSTLPNTSSLNTTDPNDPTKTVPPTTEAPITAQDAQNIANNSSTNAATLGDVLNAGWNLKNNGSAVDFVKPYDTVNFVNGQGTVAKAETKDGITTNVTFDVDLGTFNVPTDGTDKGKAIAGNTTTYTDANGNLVTKNADGTYTDAGGNPVNAGDVTENVVSHDNKIATIGDIVNTINNVFHTVNTTKTGDQITSNANATGVAVKAGDTLNFVAAKNLEITQNNHTITYGLSSDIEVNSATIGKAGKVDADGNDVVQGKDGKYYPSGTVFDPTTGEPKDAAGNPVTALDPDTLKDKNPVVELTADKGVPTTNKDENNVTTSTNEAPSALSVKDTNGNNSQINGIASALGTKDVATNNPANATTPAGKDNLVDLTPPDTTGLSPDEADKVKNKWESSAVTVGDIAKMGWIVSAEGNNYTDTVKNANEVKFIGDKGISVTGATNATTGVREITVAMEEGEVIKPNEGTVDGNPVVIVDGKVYNKADIDPTTGQPRENVTPLKDENGNDLAPDNKKVVNNGSKFVTGNKVAQAIQESGFIVGKETEAAGITFSNADEKVNPNDELRFADGKGTIVSTGTVKQTDEKGEVVTKTVVKVDVDTAKVEADTDGSIKDPLKDAKDAVKTAQDAVDAAQTALNENPTDAALQTALENAQNALNAAQAEEVKAGNKLATAGDVANAINESGWRTNSTTATGGASEVVVNPGEIVNFEAGKNMQVTQTVVTDENGKDTISYTYSTKDDVEFNSATIGKAGKVDENGNPVVQSSNGNYYPAGTQLDENGNPVDPSVQPIDPSTVKNDTAVTLTADKGVSTTDTTLEPRDPNDPNSNVTVNNPPSALSVKDANGDNSQINGIASALGTKEVGTSPSGSNDGKPTSKDTLVDLTAPTDPDDKAKWESSAVTVGDIANMGWIVSAKNNNYTDTVKNANEVKFIGDKGISVTGATNATTGVREITVAMEEGEVIKPNEGTVDGNPVVIVDGKVYNKADIDPTTGQPRENVTPLKDENGNDLAPDNKKVVNNGSKFVTGNKVAQAIQESGFIVGKETGVSAITFDNPDEKVNPNDELRFADGKGTIVSTGTVKQTDKEGKVVTKTVVKVDVDTGSSTFQDNGKAAPIKYTDENGNPITKNSDGSYFDVNGNPITKNSDGSYVDAQGNPITVTEEDQSNKVATVGDITNTINNVFHTVNTTKTSEQIISNANATGVAVKAGDMLNFVAAKNLEIKQDNHTITYGLSSDIEVNSVRIGEPGKMDLNGNRVIQAKNGNYYPAGTAIDPVTGNPVNPDAVPLDPAKLKDASVVMTPATTTVADGNIAPAVNVNGGTFTNMTSNLPGTYNDDGYNPNGNKVTESQTLPDPSKVNMTNAATVGDVLNAGWNLQNNGEAKDFVKPYDTVNFVNGTGTTAVVETSKDGKTSNVAYNVAVDDVTTEITYTNAAGQTLYKQNDGTYNTQRDGSGTKVEANNVTGSRVSAKTSPLTNKADGSVNTPANPTALATAGDVAKAINESGFTLTTTKSEGEVSGSSDYRVNPGKTVTIDAGKNIQITQNNGVVSVATSMTPTFNTVQVGNTTGPIIGGDQNGNVRIGKVDGSPAQIKNVARGTDPNDAVNVSQLKEATGDINNKINRNTKELRAGLAGARAAAGLPQVYLPGKSMVAVSAGAYQGESAIAVGYSRASDNGKLILKLQGDTNSRGKVGGSVGVGYQW